MKTLIVSRYAYLLPLVLLVSLTGCCGAPAASTLSPTGALASPTAMPLPTVAPSLTPIAELPTDTLAPSPIPPTRTPRPTAVPTVTADEEYAFVSEMLRNNGGGRLPCWWGFIPGETPWETIKTFFVSRGMTILDHGDPEDYQDYTVVFNTPSHYGGYQRYIVKDGMLDGVGIHALPPVDEDGQRMYGNPQFAEDWKAYMLPQMLEVYGPPSQIFLGLGGAAWMPFDLVLFYPEKGFLVQYSGSAERSERERHFLCARIGQRLRWISGCLSSICLWKTFRV
jgi:hypothetical protein